MKHFGSGKLRWLTAGYLFRSHATYRFLPHSQHRDGSYLYLYLSLHLVSVNAACGTLSLSLLFSVIVGMHAAVPTSCITPAAVHLVVAAATFIAPHATGVWGVSVPQVSTVSGPATPAGVSKYGVDWRPCMEGSATGVQPRFAVNLWFYYL